ncbi:MAG: hypothetical protein AAF226_12955 [Verrucomicrobiota bacterium]
MIESRLRLLKSPQLSSIREELENRIQTWSDSNFSSLRDLIQHRRISSLLQHCAERTKSDEGTIWLLAPELKHLEAVYNSGVQPSKIVGFRQSIGSGIISLVFSQEQPYCENEISEHSAHDKTLDEQAEVQTSAMIAVPFYFAFGLRGVVTMVQLGNHHKDGFSSQHVADLQRTTHIIEQLLDARLINAAMGLDGK